MSASVATLARAEAYRMARHRATWVLAAILVGYLVIIIVSFATILAAPGQMEGFDKEAFLAPLRADAVAFASTLFSGTAGILVVVLAAMVVGQEFSRGTVRTLLLAGATRRSFGLSKLVALVAVAAALALLGVAFAYGAAAAFGATLGESLVTVRPAAVAWDLLGLFVSLAGWGVLAASVTLWRGSLAMGVGSAIGLLVVGDVARGLVASLGTAGVWASRVLPNTAFGALVEGGAPAASTWLWLAPALGVWLVALPAFALWKLERMDLIAATRA